MKRLLIVVLLVCVVFCSCGCFSFLESSDESSIENSSSESGYEEDYKEWIESLIGLRDALYNNMKSAIYDEITGSMYNSDVQYMIDVFERQVKGKLSQFRIDLTYPTGSIYFPKWIAKVKEDWGTYSLVYIEVTLFNNFKCLNKKIGKYEVE